MKKTLITISIFLAVAAVFATNAAAVKNPKFAPYQGTWMSDECLLGPAGSERNGLEIEGDDVSLFVVNYQDSFCDVYVDEEERGSSKLEEQKQTIGYRDSTGHTVRVEGELLFDNDARFEKEN